ncbi:MAG: Transcriptional regulator, MerR family [Chloroflexi bacterium AL-W]|nr:Transcriptional regulator, MerR family [Chloroflexi bacterium AL-N1]NOK65032.1 Transcriptional regulator, MerR family [Chloroflexi bacterium AL-N10]NOK76802.1 Transcriptional regulator, MerR family [Chloroflexi bacterium AL-N5]NOK84694.1 Transcriptional regulator, MerR family [Chloroflexi bacterium AL-W]NOK86481.1 Transcriptional regulator, MerR family [Chloroflexi bacterium AL-N15]
MNDQRQGMLSIGQFVRATQLSIKALRLYEQLEILPPRYVDPESGYRYYHNDQLLLAHLIRMMRQMDMPLATIRRVLAATPADTETLVHDYWQAQEKRMEQSRRIVHDLVSQLQQEAATVALEICVKSLSVQPIISITHHIKAHQLPDYVANSLDTLYELLEEQAIGAASAPLGLYHGPITQDDDGPMAVCVPVQRQIVTTSNITARQLESGQAVSVMLRGEQCEFPAMLQGNNYSQTAYAC